MNTQMKYTPSVMTDPGFMTRKMKRNGLCRPASASTMSMTRPMPMKIGARMRPATRMRTASGYFRSM